MPYKALNGLIYKAPKGIMGILGEPLGNIEGFARMILQHFLPESFLYIHRFQCPTMTFVGTQIFLHTNMALYRYPGYETAQGWTAKAL